MNVRSVLLVDDDESTNFINSIFIAKLNIDVDVYTALNGLEALEILKDSKDYPDFFPCLIILDINMPVMNGWAFLDKYQNLSLKIKDNTVVVITTISEDEKDFVKANRNEDIKEFLQKPMSDEKFSMLINEYFL